MAERHKSPLRVNFEPLACWVAWTLAESRHKIKSLHLGMARIVKAFPSPLPLSLPQVSFSLAHADYLGELVLSDLGWQSCSGLRSLSRNPWSRGCCRWGFSKTQPLFLSQQPTCLAGEGSSWPGSFPFVVEGGHISLSEPLHCSQFTFNIICVYMFAHVHRSLWVPQWDCDRKYV